MNLTLSGYTLNNCCSSGATLPLKGHSKSENSIIVTAAFVEPFEGALANSTRGVSMGGPASFAFNPARLPGSAPVGTEDFSCGVSGFCAMEEDGIAIAMNRKRRNNWAGTSTKKATTAFPDSPRN